jgi:division protein CdvB (Snf7/Vps24/ESCRT-III family)
MDEDMDEAHHHHMEEDMDEDLDELLKPPYNVEWESVVREYLKTINN